MSLYLNFEPHSHYMGFAIRDNRTEGHDQQGLERSLDNDEGHRWSGYTDNGNTYRVDELHADTLRELRGQIKQYRAREAARIKELYS